MPERNARTTVSFPRKVVAWLDYERMVRRHGPRNGIAVHRAHDFGASEERVVSRDGIVVEGIALLSHVQNRQVMTEIFGREAGTVQEKLLGYLNSNRDPSE